jgi:hypothetical protein
MTHEQLQAIRNMALHVRRCWEAAYKIAMEEGRAVSLLSDRYV